MRILAVEDEPDAAAVLAKGLREHRWIAHMHGGDVALTSSAPGHTTFTAVLPDNG